MQFSLTYNMTRVLPILRPRLLLQMVMFCNIPTKFRACTMFSRCPFRKDVLDFNKRGLLKVEVLFCSKP